MIWRTIFICIAPELFRLHCVFYFCSDCLITGYLHRVCLARSANLPEGLYILPSVISGLLILLFTERREKLGTCIQTVSGIGMKF